MFLAIYNFCEGAGDLIMLKKILCGLICSVFVMNILPIANAEQDVDNNELNLSKYYLEGIGIDVSFAEETTVSRGEFVSNALGLINRVPYETDDYTAFSDVTAYNEWADAIYTAYQMKIVQGNNSEFRPNDPIKTIEAAIILTNMLGYGTIIAGNNAGIDGYISYSANNNLIPKGTSIDDVVSGQALAIMMKRALLTDVWQSDLSSVNTKYTTIKNENMLYTYFNLEEKSGVVTAVNRTSLTDPDYELNDNKIGINGTLYNTEKDYEKYLGYNVKAYVDRNDDEELKFIVPYNNNSITVMAADLESLQDNFLYKSGSTRQKYTLDNSYAFIYNGRACATPTEDKVIPDSGFVTLLDNDRDGKYDVVLTKSYTVLKVTSVNQYDGIIYGESNVFSSGLRVKDDDTYFEYYKDQTMGEETIEFADIKSDQILLAAVSEDKKVGEIRVCENFITGKIDSTGSDSEVTIDGEQYKATQYFLQHYKNIVGTNGRFYIAPDGKIAAASISKENKWEYGYVINLIKNEDDTYALKICTSSDEKKVYEIVDKCIVDGKKVKQQENLTTLLRNESGVGYNQIVRYLLDGDKIKSIDLPEQAEAISDENYSTSNSLTCINKKHTSYMKSGNLAFDKFFLTGGVTLFLVNKAADESGIVTSDDVSCSGTDFFRNDNQYTLSTYDLDSSGHFQAAVVYADNLDKNISEESEIGVIEKVCEAVNDDGDFGKKIYLWNNGSFVKYFAPEEIDLDSQIGNMTLGKGDVVRYELKDGDINKMVVDFDCSEMKFTDIGSTLRKGAGGCASLISYELYSPYKRYGTYFYMSSKTKPDGSYDYSAEAMEGRELGTAKCLLVNRETGTLKAITIDDLGDYCSNINTDVKLFTRTRHWQYYMVIAYTEGEI